MLIEFSVTNFKTIRGTATLSMVAEKLQGNEASASPVFSPKNYKDIPLLRSAVIYGANASGKTNLLESLVLFSDMIHDSTDTKLGESLRFEPYALSKDGPQSPTVFEMEFLAIDNVRYLYGFSYHEAEILEEHLISFAHNNRRTEVYTREKGLPIKFGSSFKGSKRSLEEQLQSNHLLLTKAANSNFVQFHPIYLYFKSHLKVVFSQIESARFTKKQAYNDPSFLEKVNSLLKQADTGIESIHVSLKEDRKDAPLRERRSESLDNSDAFETTVLHKFQDGEVSKSVEWPMELESLGTQRLFALAGAFVDVLANGHVFFVDELNNHFHPMLSAMLVGLFNNPATNPRNAQLIFTTHDVSLLNKENFRRDQIWFIEKNQEGTARLFPLSAFDKKQVRWDIPFDKWYLSGRFGATPLIGDADISIK
jgi:uncharacterized protein